MYCSANISDYNNDSDNNEIADPTELSVVNNVISLVVLWCLYDVVASS